MTSRILRSWAPKIIMRRGARALPREPLSLSHGLARHPPAPRARSDLIAAAREAAAATARLEALLARADAAVLGELKADAEFARLAAALADAPACRALLPREDARAPGPAALTFSMLPERELMRLAAMLRAPELSAAAAASRFLKAKLATLAPQVDRARAGTTTSARTTSPASSRARSSPTASRARRAGAAATSRASCTRRSCTR